MNETPTLFPITHSEFWKQIRTTIEEAVTEKLTQENLSKSISLLPEKALLKASDVCEIFQVSKSTLYEMVEAKKIKSFKVKSRRYFNWANIDALI